MLISIIIPYYNRERYLERCLQSVVQQTHRPLQVILVDNGSTDRSATLCQAFAEAFGSADFTVINTQEAKKGACAARNKGLSLAVSEYVSFFDSDDEMSPTYIADIVAAIRRNPADVYAVKTRMTDENDRDIPRKIYMTTAVDDHIYTCFLNTQAYVIRRQLLLDIGAWDESLHIWNDWELGIRILTANPRLIWLKKGLYHRIHLHHNSLTSNNFSQSGKALMEATKKAYKDIDESHISTKEKRRCRWAICAKLAILSGHFAGEGNSDYAQEALSLAHAHCGKNNSFFKAACTGLHHYTRLHGRAGWLIAKQLRTLLWLWR